MTPSRCSTRSAMPAPSTALPGSPSSVTIPLCTVTVNRAGSVKNPSAMTSWVISRRISSSLRRKTLSGLPYGAPTFRN